MSGPAILRLSAWGARELFDRKYSFKLHVNWLGERTVEETKTDLNHWKSINSRKFVATTTPQYLSLPNTSGQPQGLPTRLWQRLVAAADISENLNWADVSKKQIQQLAEQLAASVFEVNGKSTFKEEFVTAGGVRRDEVNFKTFESKLFPNLFFAGEVLDIDAITGGFNFQAAWSGGWIAGQAMASNI